MFEPEEISKPGCRDTNAWFMVASLDYPWNLDRGMIKLKAIHKGYMLLSYLDEKVDYVYNLLEQAIESV